MEEKKLTLDDVIDGEKTLREYSEEDFDGAKQLVFEKIRAEIIPDEETLKHFRIKRIVHEPVISQIVFDRVTKNDNVVYKKDTAKLDKILKEINTLENGEAEE